MRNKLLFLLAGAMLLSCARENIETLRDQSGTMIPVSQVPLYANLEKYNLVESPGTRADDEEMVSLESLLDYAKATSQKMGDYTVTQIPFLQNEQNIYTLTFTEDHDTSQDVPTRVKKFLIKATDGQNEYEFVAVLMTSFEYADNNKGFDWFEKPNYTGTIFFCTPEGELIRTCDYTDGNILPAKMLTPEESEMNTDPETKRIVLLKPSNTRSDIPWWSDGWAGARNWGAACVDFVPLNPKHGGGGTGDGNDDDNVTGGDDNAPPGTTKDGVFDNFGYGILLPNLPPILVQMIQVKLTTNEEGIRMIGDGVFEKGTIIHISYETEDYVQKANFTHWTGTFRLKTTVEFNYNVQEYVESTAYFNVEKAPCHNAETNMTNPLKNMSVAPTDSGDYLKGLYHATVRRYEDGVPIYHWGLDLAAEPGTPVYAAASGRIVKVKKKCPSGSKGADYNGGFGNEIIIACDGYIKPYDDDLNFQDINIVYMQYAHLQHGNAIAYNYKEGRVFQVGDKVQAGEIIGYTGKSGNAYNVTHPHLHYGISFDGDDKGNVVYHSWVDPADFINGTIDVKQLKQTNGKIQTDDCH